MAATGKRISPSISISSARAAGRPLSYADVPGEKTKLKIGKSSPKAGETVAVTMEPGGGFVMILGKR